jgi:hypothetical protein
MKTKKKVNAAASRFVRGERVVAKSRRGARKMDGQSRRPTDETLKTGSLGA